MHNGIKWVTFTVSAKAQFQRSKATVERMGMDTIRAELQEQFCQMVDSGMATIEVEEVKPAAIRVNRGEVLEPKDRKRLEELARDYACDAAGLVDHDWTRPVDELVAVACQHACYGRTALAIRALLEENTDLHLVAQGVKHYWQCSRDFTGGDGHQICYRCLYEDMKAENAKLRKVANEVWAVIKDSNGVDGFHLNGDTALWDEFGDLMEALKEAGVMG